MTIFHYKKNINKGLLLGLLLLSSLINQSCDSKKELPISSSLASVTQANERCLGGATFENETIDCAGARIGLSCNGDNEHQPAVLTLKNASVKNLIITADGGSNGIQCISGNCVLKNVVWEDICEDAAALIKDGKSMTIDGGWAFNSLDGLGGKPDKVFQHNAGPGSTITITGGFTAKGVNGKLWRSCGNCKNNTGPRHLIVDNVRIEGKMNTVAALNVNEGFNDTVTISNLFIENYRPKKPKICRAYLGSTRKDETTAPKSLGEEWDSNNCRVRPSDINAFSVIRKIN